MLRQTGLMKRQETELKVFQKKVQAKVETLKKQRALELERMLLKYQNLVKELEAQHALDIAKVQKRPGSGSANRSVYVSKLPVHKGSIHKMSMCKYFKEP